MRSVVAGDKVEKVGFGRFDDREKRFRARRRLCWIGQRDPGSMLSRLPAHVLDEVVPYFDPAPRAAV